MCSPFEGYLESIADEISTPAYNIDVNYVLNFVISRLQTYSSSFNMFFHKSISIGPTAHGTRLYNNALEDELDVVLLFKLPCYQLIEIYDNQDGYDMLDTSNVSTDLIMEDEKNYINLHYLQQWLKGIFENAFNEEPTGFYYKLSYELNDMRHTIFASSGSYNFSIDFVPGICILYEQNSVDWHAIPKLMPESKAKYSFMISNSEQEKYLLNDKDLKRAILLVQALCASKGLEKIYYYHLTNLVLSNDIEEYAKDNSLQDIFIEILRHLYNAINSKHLPYVWKFEINLLSNLTPKELSEYEEILDGAYNTLSTYWHQEELSYETCDNHFKY